MATGNSVVSFSLAVSSRLLLIVSILRDFLPAGLLTPPYPTSVPPRDRRKRKRVISTLKEGKGPGGHL